MTILFLFWITVLLLAAVVIAYLQVRWDWLTERRRMDKLSDLVDSGVFTAGLEMDDNGGVFVEYATPGMNMGADPDFDKERGLVLRNQNSLREAVDKLLSKLERQEMKYETKILPADVALAFLENMRWFADMGPITAKRLASGEYSVRATPAAWSNFKLPGKERT